MTIIRSSGTAIEPKFTLGQLVETTMAEEGGKIIGVAFYDTTTAPQYFLRFKAGDGCQREAWFDEEAIKPLGT